MSNVLIREEVSEGDDRGFCVRIVSWEERLQWPVAELDTCFSEFSGSRVKRVPIISIFGSTPQNQSVCLHIHKVFPYFYVPFPTTFSTTTEEGVEFLMSLGSELESALNCGTQWTMQRIFNLQIVFAKSIYGFHENNDLFIKIVLYNPRDVTRAGEILQSGGILGMKFQPFETHIPFFLQFKMDYNLYGMDMIEVSRVQFRTPSHQTTLSRLGRWISTDSKDKRQSTPKTKTMTPCGANRLDRVSSCDLEVDATADEIMNIHQLDWRSIDDVDENTKLVQSLIPMWKMMSNSNKDPMQIDRNFEGDLSSHVVGIRQRIRDIQSQYQTKQENKESLRQTPSCSSIHGLSESDRSSVLAANVLLDKHSACACPSPLHEEDLVDDVSPEDPESFTQMTREDDDDDDDLGLLMELADIAEEDDYIQDEEQDILTSIQEAQNEEVPRTGQDHHEDNQTSPIKSDDQLDDHSEDLEVIDQVTAVPMNRPPKLSEINSNLDQLITQKSNQGPVYRLASDGSFNTKAWLQIPSFSNSSPIWDRLNLQFSKSMNERTSMYDENDQWIWTTCNAPPSIQEASDWLLRTPQEDPICSENQQTEAPYGERPDSPDYDETSSYYHTPRSRKALSSQLITTSTPNFKSSAFGAPSDLAGPPEAPPSSFQSHRIEPLIEDLHAEQQLVICTIEIHAASRGALLSDPAHDAIHCIIIKAMEDSNHQNRQSKILIFHPAADLIREDWQNLMGLERVMFKFHDNEKELLISFIQELLNLDPDIIIGFDLVKASLGYLTERAILLGLNLLNEISRMPMKRSVNPSESGSNSTMLLASSGRILLNAWRILRSEIKLNIYTFENCVAEILKIRIPKIEQSTLHSWFSSSSPIEFDRCLRHLMMKSEHLLSMVIELDVIHRTSEMARLYGIDFYSVLSRGSQYRVESMLIRLAHSQNYLVISPSKQQVYDQPAMECLPLVLEPKSEVHCDPVVVLDFQSLYPSLVIAYNLCFSTICLKNVSGMNQSFQLGVSLYQTPQSVLDGGIRSQDLIISPNGMCFAPPSIRKGILPQLLKEILATRILIKHQMKTIDSTNKSILRLLNARQFGLKMIANVSYGYSAAGFSGRMPMAELADSIVQSGRQTLMNAIELIQTHPRWNAEVVYGDSIAEGTSLLLRIDGEILIREVRELGGFGFNLWRGYRGSKEICELVGVETWTEGGWTEVQSLIRHKWDPRRSLVKVETTLGSITCTEDHSLLLEDGSEIRPEEIENGTLLMASLPALEYYCDDRGPGFESFHGKLLGMFVNLWNQGVAIVSDVTGQITCFAYSDEKWLIDEYFAGAKQAFPQLDWSIRSDGFGHDLIIEGPNKSKINEFENYIKFHTLDKEGKAQVPDFVLNASFEIRDAFWTGFCDGYLVWNNTKVITKPNPRLSLGIMLLASSNCCYPYITDGNVYLRDHGPEEKAKVTNIERVKQETGYVYDLSTSNHHFQAGTGALIVHNTDSVFVKLRDCSRSKAFEIGNEIADVVTRSNPAPVELKMEKVYHPCVLLTKKHYVGHSFTSPDQNQPHFDAKGIETIRRDSCPAVAKILEKTLTLLFDEKDFNQIRTYLERQWSKILTGRVNLKDFIFSKEVREGHYRSRVLPPAAVVAAEAQRLDSRRGPQPGERVPYLVVYGHPGQRLVDLVVEPQRLILSSGDLKLNALYYIKKQINPALDRVLSLSGVSVQDWFLRMPGSIRRSQMKTRRNVKRQKTIDSYFLSRHCPICDDVTSGTGILCRSCKDDGQKSMGVISTKLNRLESQLTAVESVCRHCLSTPSTSLCHSLDCALYFDRIKLNEELKTTRRYFDQISELF